ncbi:MAG: hypothetical protein ACOCXT_06650 [Candidatus Dojkabacteria bacterium]
MPPRSPEEGYENQITPEEEKYLQMERGDVDLDPTSAQGQAQAQISAQNIPTNQQTPSSQSDNQNDPVEIFKRLISAGFTPTRQQIRLASSHISEDPERADYWATILLKKLIKQYKQNQKK